MRDPYSVLGVRRDAGPDEIKAAWRSKAKSAHPDQNRDDPSATGRFAEIGQAYDILKDPKKRTRFDERLKRAETGEQTFQQKREAAREAAERAKAARARAEEVIREMERAEAARQAQAQGQAQAQAQTTKGRTQTAAPGMETPEEVISRIFGVPPEQAASSARAAENKEASGKASGFAGPDGEETNEDGESRETVAARAGSLPAQAMDLLATWMRRIRGVPPLPDKAPDLSAVATVTVDDLMKLNWVKVALPDDKDGRFQIEPGAADGDVIRLRGQGLKLQGMQRGDVVVTLRLDPAGPFRVESSDVHTVLPVNLEHAVLGWTGIADSPSGPVEVTIPAWSGSDQTVRLVGRGLPKATGGRGDLVVELRLMLWDKPDAKVTDLMRSMREGLYL